MIDTPGEQHKAGLKNRGVYLGDIGVFIIEISKILDRSGISVEKNEYLSQMLLWKESRGMGNLIIVLSKMDLPGYGFSEENYLKAKKVLIDICGGDVPVIPISIDIEGRDDHNIFKKSSIMDWYTGLPLKEYLDKLFVFNYSIEKDIFFMYIHRSFKKVPGVGSTWEGKILKGILQQSDDIKLCPVKVNGKYENISAKIKSIRLVDTSVNTKEAHSGDIIGIDISNVKMNNKDSIKKSSFNTQHTSCVVLNSTKVTLGNIAKFSINLDTLVQPQ